MNDSEIIKALEQCTITKDKFCISCPLAKEENCTLKMIDQALDLIHRQQDEIERLTQENNALNGNTEKYIKECENRSRQMAEGCRKEIKSEAVREFAEKLKSMLSFGKYTSYEQIDNLVKEIGCNDG